MYWQTASSGHWRKPLKGENAMSMQSQVRRLSAVVLDNFPDVSSRRRQWLVKRPLEVQRLLAHARRILAEER